MRPSDNKGAMMSALSPKTIRRLNLLFPKENQSEVEQLLLQRCGNNLTFLENLSPVALERFQFAALKLSQGNLEKLRKAVVLAETDWRDLLVAADFAEDVTAHSRWLPDSFDMALMNKPAGFLEEDFQGLPFDVSKHAEALKSFAALNLLPRSIKPTLCARDLIVLHVPSCKFRIEVTDNPVVQEEMERKDGSIAFEILYQADNSAEAEQVSGEVKRYFLRHYPGRILSSRQEAKKEILAGNCVYVACYPPSPLPATESETIP